MISTIAAALVSLTMMQQVHPEVAIPSPPRVEAVTPPVSAPRPPLPAPRRDAAGREIKGGLTPIDYAYTMPRGVTFKEVAYFSDGIACYAKIFYPPGFNAQTSRNAAVVLGQGYAGTHVSIEKYGARFAERGLVAMVIDYRGWGNSMGFPRVVSPIDLSGGMERDETRHSLTTAQVWFKRTRLIPQLQQEDYRAAISYIQGEPGVNPDLIGVWGSSLAGGNATAVFGQDARVKVAVVQIPSITGNVNGSPATQMNAAMLADSIQRARSGQGGEFYTGFSRMLLVDNESNLRQMENNTMQWTRNIGERPYMVIVAEHDQLINNDRSGKVAVEMARGPHEYIVVPNIGHFDMYSGEPFEISSNAAARWFTTYLK